MAKKSKMKKTDILPLTLVVLSGALFSCGKTSPESTGSEKNSQDYTLSEKLPSVSEADTTTLRVGSLKGPTTLGLVNLMKAIENKKSKGNYTFDMQTQAPTIASALIQGNLDAALVPANLASTIYNKTKGAVTCLNINTLGVLYCVSGNDEITGMASLSGKTVLMTGQGTTPQYTMEYLLAQNNITDCTLEYHSEATEIAALLKTDSNKIAILPQPFVTVAEKQNTAISTRFSLAEEWHKVNADSDIVTSVTIIRNAFLKNHPTVVRTFLDEQKASVEKTASDLDTTAKLAVEYGIIGAEPVAKLAIPQCAISDIGGNEMKTKLSGYLNVLFTADAKAIGGAMPADDFYYLG